MKANKNYPFGTPPVSRAVRGTMEHVRPETQLKRGNADAKVAAFNLAHSWGTPVRWRANRDHGEGFTITPAYRDRTDAVVHLSGHLMPIPLDWIVSTDESFDSEGDE